MVTTKLNLSMTEPSVRQIYAKQGDTGRVLDISLDQTPEDGTLRILRPDGVEVTSDAVTGGEVESGSTFESLTEADVTELTVGIEPVQDLNGYDKPWVGGAGKNKLNNTATTTTYRGIAFTVNSDGTVTANGTATGGDATITIRVDTSSVYGDFYFNALYGYTSDTSFNAYMWDVTTGARCKQWDGTTNSVNSYNGTLRQVKIVQGNTTYMSLRVMNGATANNVVFYPMIVASTETDPTWQPYSNICPITGHDEVTVTRTGKNLLNLNVTSKTQNGITFTVNADGSIKVNGAATSGNAYFTKTTGAPPKMTKGTTVTLSGVEGSTTNQLYLQLIYIGADGSTISITSVSGATTYTFAQDATFSAYWLTVRQGATHDNTMVYPQLELGSTATAYEPYQGSTYTTSLGQTVYGGTLDMVSGVLTVDRAMVSLSGSDLGIGSSQTKELNMWRLPLNNPYGTLASSYPSGISNKYVMRNSYNGVNNNNGSLGLNQTSGSQILIRDDSLTTAQEVIDAFNSTPLTFVYPLATPQTYQLTAQQIKTLVGTNNVWASSGDIVNIKFTYGGLLSELPSDATSVVGKCYCDVEQNGVSSMPFTLNVKKNERES